MSQTLQVVVDGLDHVALVASEDAILVGRLSEAQNVGKMVKLLQSSDDTVGLAQTHLTSYRRLGRLLLGFER